MGRGADNINANRLRFTYVDIFISKECQRERRIGGHRQGISKLGNFDHIYYTCNSDITKTKLDLLMNINIVLPGVKLTTVFIFIIKGVGGKKGKVEKRKKKDDEKDKKEKFDKKAKVEHCF